MLLSVRKRDAQKINFSFNCGTGNNKPVGVGYAEGISISLDNKDVSGSLIVEARNPRLFYPTTST